MKLVAEIPFAVLIAGAVIVGLWISNILFDAGIPHYVSRKIGHSAGGLGFLLCAFVFSSGWWPLIISLGFTLMLWVARYVRPDTFRGVGGSGRSTKAMAEIWFPLSAILVIGTGWIWLGKPILAVSCLLFMAWGDCVTGLVRSQIYGRAVKGFWGSVAMFLTCLVISWAFIKPFWIGAIASSVATVVEITSGDVSPVPFLRWLDDNFAIPVASAIVIFGLLAMRGGL